MKVEKINDFLESEKGELTKSSGKKASKIA